MTKNKIKAKAADDKNLQALVCEELSDSESAAVVGGLSQRSLKELLADVKAKLTKTESDNQSDASCIGCKVDLTERKERDRGDRVVLIRESSSIGGETGTL